MESLATPLVATVVCLGVGYLGLPFLAQQILNLGLKLMNMTEVWQQTVIVKDPRAIVQCVLKGDLGFGEAFMAGKIDFAKSAQAQASSKQGQGGGNREDLDSMADAGLAFFRAAVDPKTSQLYSWWLIPAAHAYVLWALVADWFVNLQSVKRSKEAISAHYDRSTKVIECMTAPSFVYTCGHWQAGAQDVTEAQRAKMQLVCEKLLLPKKTPNSPPPTMEILDIGCGYGALGKFMTEYYNVKFTGISISEEQVAWANANVCHANLKVVLCDYRKMPQEWKFDGITSVGMFEAVGPRNYVEFMRVHERHLKDGGLVLLHTITQTFTTKVNLSPWLIKYIFPDGTLPSLAQVFTACEKVLVPEDMHQFGPDYARTLEAWRKDWLSREASGELDCVEGATTPEFRRMWWLYLTMCQALFEVRHANLTQFVFSKRGVRDSAKILKVREASSRLDLAAAAKDSSVFSAKPGYEPGLVVG